MNIKCKAWDSTHKQWVDYGFCLRFDQAGNAEILNAFAQPFTDRELVPVLSTGIKDRKGVEVYEGDVVITNNEDVYGDPAEDHYRGVVTYVDKEGVYQIIQSHDSYTPLLCNRAIVSMEIIGNIYETPELLGGQQSG